MKPSSTLFFVVLLWMCAGAPVAAQPTGGTPDLPTATQEYLEIQVQEGADYELEEVYDRLAAFRDNPLNINKAEREDLEELLLLNELQVQSLLTYREQYGNLIDIHELQAVPNFDMPLIQALLPFVVVNGGFDKYNVPIGKLLVGGNYTATARYRRVLEPSRGYQPLIVGGTETKYLGSPDNVFFRFRQQYENRSSWGVTMEKDAGEEFFSGSNRRGFDFYSAHLFVKDITPVVRAVALGDYTVGFGQGLIVANGFGAGKSSYVMNIKRSGRALRPYASVGEVSFFRGAAATIRVAPKLELTAFGSYKPTDANAVLDTITFDDPDVTSVSSFQTSGYHRTNEEIADKNSLKVLTTGGSLQYTEKRWSIGLNGIFSRLSDSLTVNYYPYNQYNFSGIQLANFSLHYAAVLGNLNFFGETARSDNGGIATINGAFLSLDRKVDFAMLHRYFAPNYQRLYYDAPSVFSENTKIANENGLYYGINIRPNNNWDISAYFDAYRFPWLRSDADAPSKGYEYLLKLTYRIKRKMEAYITFRNELKDTNQPDNELPTNPLVTHRRTQIRLHLENKVTKEFTLRNRAEWIADNDGLNPTQKGFLVYQDILYKPIAVPLSFTTRFALFHTDSYAARVYAYENDLLYQFSVPPYYNKGTRFYINARWQGIRNLSVELRFAQTWYADQNTFGSGWDEIARPQRSEIKAQVQYKF
jgi:hypothetical protein